MPIIHRHDLQNLTKYASWKMNYIIFPSYYFQNSRFFVNFGSYPYPHFGMYSVLHLCRYLAFAPHAIEVYPRLNGCMHYSLNVIFSTLTLIKVHYCVNPIKRLLIDVVSFIIMSMALRIKDFDSYFVQ